MRIPFLPLLGSPARGLCLAVVLLLLAVVVHVRAEEALKAPSDTSQVGQVYFVTDVVPLLTKLGCNSGGCHGKATGQNGFKLSLLGYEPDLDYASIVNEARGRRLFPAAPERSLLVLKATGAVPHGGGTRIGFGSEDYRVLLQWLRAGAPSAAADDPVISRIAVSPERLVFDSGSQEQPLLVTAQLSDGTHRDVTRLAIYQSNEPDIAEVGDDGAVLTKGRCGLFAVMVRYGDQIAVFHGVVPFRRAAQSPVSADLGPGASQSLPIEGGNDLSGQERSPYWLDEYLVAQWTRLALAPSPPATDAEFIRRATLDICGTLPTLDEVQAYVSDPQPGKQARLIDRLLSRPEYASYFAIKWAGILQNRGAGYSTSRQRAGTALFTGWIRDCLAANVPYDRFVSEILTAVGSQETQPPTVWYRTVRTTENYVESVSQAFLGVRVQCAQCHHHPAERWSQADYYGLAAIFARVGRKGGFADAEVPTNEVIYLAEEGQVVHPRTGQVMQPRPLGGPDLSLGRYDDPRRSLAAWMTSPDNPYFARTLVNRMWGHFLGRGIIHPIDDARSTNPPSNPELLDALARDFVASGFDVKHLIRVIANSRAYALSASPNETNREDVLAFARYYPRRLPAEVMLDAMSQVLDAPTTFSAGPGPFPAGTRAIDLPDEAVPSHFLDVFGRPRRSSACECERVDAPALGQALELVSSAEIQQKLAAPHALPQVLAGNGKAHAENVQDVFLRAYARPPRPEELETACQFLAAAPDRSEAYQSLVWSLLATNEFLFNH